MMQYSRPAARGWYKPHNGPYGAPRGNRVLASKRISGPSAETLMRLRIALETCDHAGCENPPAITRSVTASVSTSESYCMEHAVPPCKTTQRVVDLLDLPWQSVWEQK